MLISFFAFLQRWALHSIDSERLQLFVEDFDCVVMERGMIGLTVAVMCVFRCRCKEGLQDEEFLQ